MHGVHNFWNPIDRSCATSGYEIAGALFTP
jgi:hypothetical protein